MEGYASIRINGTQGSTKSKFSFLFHVPSLGRIEGFDLLGRTIYQIFFNREKACFVIPSKGVYWQGGAEEIFYRLMGLRLNTNEMIELLSGQWKNIAIGSKENNFQEDWKLKYGKMGEIIAGRRGDFYFEVKEFIGQTSFVRRLIFYNKSNKGNLKILAISFNQPVKISVFSLISLQKYEKKTWKEIIKILEKLRS